MPTLKYKWIRRADADVDAADAPRAQEHVAGATWSAAPAVRPDPVISNTSASAAVASNDSAAAAAARPLVYGVPVPPRSVVPPTFTATGPYYQQQQQQHQQQQPETLLKRYVTADSFHSAAPDDDAAVWESSAAEAPIEDNGPHAGNRNAALAATNAAMMAASNAALEESLRIRRRADELRLISQTLASSSGGGGMEVGLPAHAAGPPAKKEVDDANLSAFSADEVDVAFDADKKEALSPEQVSAALMLTNMISHAKRPPRSPVNEAKKKASAAPMLTNVLPIKRLPRGPDNKAKKKARSSSACSLSSRSAAAVSSPPPSKVDTSVAGAIPTNSTNHFLPGGIGIKKPHPHDILSGRGGISNNHMGNKIFRTVCEHNKELYATFPRNEKLHVAVRLVEAVRSRDPPGRFLERKKGDKLWYEVTEKRVVEKTAQAMREKVHKAIRLPRDEIPAEFVHLLEEEAEASEVEAAFDAAKKKKAVELEAASERHPFEDFCTSQPEQFLAQAAKKPQRDLPQDVQKVPSGNFTSVTRWGGKPRYIGTFDTRKQAAAAFESVRKDLDEAKLSGVCADEVNDFFEAAKTKALEAFGGFVPWQRDVPRGVRKLPSGNYKAMTWWGGKNRYFGTFDTSEQASAAYKSVKKDLARAKLSGFGPDEVDVIFDAAQKKALESVGGYIPRKRQRTE